MSQTMLQSILNRVFQVLTLHVCVLVVGCSSAVDPNKAIVGTWLTETEGGEWTFRSDGTATEHLTKADKKAEYKYKIVDGDKLDLTGEGTKMLCLYRFDGPDRLSIMSGSSQTRPKEISDKKGNPFFLLTKLKRQT